MALVESRRERERIEGRRKTREGEREIGRQTRKRERE